MKRILKAIYELVKRMVKPVLVRFPRLHSFARLQRSAFIELLRPGSHSAAQAAMSEEQKGWAEIPGFVFDEMAFMHSTVEPAINAGYYRHQRVMPHRVPDATIVKHYWEMVRRCGPRPEFVLLAPWITRGGADLVLLNYARALEALGKAQQTLVITTLNADSPWAGNLPKGIRFVEMGRLCSDLHEAEREFLLARLLIQMQPRVIHNQNSALAYRVFIKHGAALKRYSSLYSHVFCIDLDEQGAMAGYPVTYLPQCFDHLTALMSENRAVLDRLRDLYAFDERKLICHYQPVSFKAALASDAEIERKAAKQTLDVLWCNRIDRQKRPDVLIKVIERCSDQPFVFHIYGGALLDRDIYTEKLRSLPNVRFHGPYDGFHSLPFENFDVMLYTSQWDGIPTILFESMAVGLPIIASDTGGIREIIIDGQTGFLVSPFDDPEGYVNALKLYNSDRSISRRLIHGAIAHVSARHTQEGFLADLRAVPGYMSQ